MACAKPGGAGGRAQGGSWTGRKVAVGRLTSLRADIEAAGLPST